MKTLNTILLAVTVTLLSACNSEKEYDATGTFEATEIIVSSEANGKLFYLNAEEGTRLSQGTEVGLVDTVQLYLKKLQLQANMKSVDSQRPDIHKQIAATQEQIVTAKRERARVETYWKPMPLTGNNWTIGIHSWLYYNANLMLKSLLYKTVPPAEWTKFSVAIQVAQVEDQLQKCHVLAPINGTILAKYAEPGELASVGKPLLKLPTLKICTYGPISLPPNSPRSS